MKEYLSKNLFFIILAVAIMLLVILFATGSIPNTNIPTVLTSLLSTFIGASFAFHLNTAKERRKEDDAEIASLRVALFTIAQQQNTVVNLYKTIGAWRDRKDRALRMRPISPPDHSHLRQDLAALSFMLEDEPGLLLELSVEDDRFAQVITSIKQHMEFHVAEVQPAIEKHNLRGKSLSIEEIRNVMGARIYDTAAALADSIFEHVVATEDSLRIISPKIFCYAKARFADKKFLKTSFDLDEQVGNTPREA